MNKTEFITIESEIYPIGPKFYRYLRNETEDILDVRLDGSKVKIKSPNGGVISYDLQKLAERSPSRWREVLQHADIEPVNEKIIKLSQQLPGKISLEKCN